MEPGDRRKHAHAPAAGLASTLEAVGSSPAEPAHDAFLDPGEAREALESLRDPSGGAALLRVMPELGARAGDFAPKPAPPWWLRIEAGGVVRAVEAVGEPSAIEGRAKAVGLETIAVAVPGGKTPERTLSRVVLSLEGGRRFVVCERLGATITASLTGVSPLAHALAEILGVDVEGSLADDAPAPTTPPLAPARRAGDLARHALRFEGEVAVLRDHGSGGPRDALGRHVGLAVGFAAGAVVMWILFARTATGDSGWTTLFGLGAVALILSVAAYAFAGVARFAAKYRAASRPLLWIGPDRFVVAPWVDRDGAVDRRPEGRLGAAISLRELQGVSVRPRDDSFAVELATEHGPMDAMSGLDEDLATFWCRVLEARLADASDPLAAPKRRAQKAARAQTAAGDASARAQAGPADSLPMKARANR